MGHEVIISYSHADKLQADAICNRLEAQGIRCWIAPRDVPVGTEYADSIVQAIETARVLVLVYSKSADESKQVRREVERAVSHGTHIMPVRIEDTEMSQSFEYYVGSIHWLDAITPPLEEHIDKLAHDLRALLVNEPTPSPEPEPEPEPEPDSELEAEPERAPESVTPPRPRAAPAAGKRRWIGIAAAALVAVAAVFYFMVLARPVVVQDVAGMPESEARTVLEGQGFLVDVTLERADQAAGQATRTVPPAGREARRRSTVALFVSGTIVLPQLVGRSEEAAVELLASRSAGSHAFPREGIVIEEEPGGEEGFVVRSSPEAGELVLIGDTVTLFVAGPQVTVPDVTGQTASAAGAAVEAAQLQPVLVNDWEPGRAIGSVLRTEPSPGTAVDRRSEVTVFVAGTGGWAYINDRSLSPGDTIPMPRGLTLRTEPRTGARALTAVDKDVLVRVLDRPTGDGWVKIVVN